VNIKEGAMVEDHVSVSSLGWEDGAIATIAKTI